MAGPGNESHASPITLHAEQDRPVLVFPISDLSPVCARWSRISVDRCPKHPNGHRICRRFLKAQEDDRGNKGDEPEPNPADAELPLPPPYSQLEADYHPADEMCPATPPQVVQSWARTPTLPDNESTSVLEPADAEPRLQPQSPSGAASGRGVDPQQRSGGHSQHRDHHNDNDRTSSLEQPHLFAEDDRGESVACSPTPPGDESTSEPESADAELDPADAEPRLQPRSPHRAVLGCGVDLQQRSGSCGLSQHRDHRDDSDQASGPEQRLAPDDGGEKNDEEGRAAPPPVRESVAGLPTLPDDGGNDDHEPAGASPPVQPPADRDQANLQHIAGRCDATTGGMASQRDLSCRRYDNTDDGEDYCPSVCSDAEHSGDDVVRPPRRKRRRVSTMTTAIGGTAQHPSYGDSSSRRTRRQRGAAYPLSPRERDSTPAATFEELPLGDAVLRRVTRNGSPPTFMVQFTWDSCAEHTTSNEWPLGDAVLKRVTMDGSPPTFAVQFTWDPRVEHGAGHCGTENQGTTAKRHRPARQKSNGTRKCKGKPASTSRRARYTPADDAKILELKGQGLSWSAIAEEFPGRSAGAIQVRYQTKLKTTEEWEVEEICGKNRRDDGGWELHVKWKGGEETWEPYDYVAETEALDEYERLYGPVTVYTV